LIWLFPLTFLISAFVPISSMPAIRLHDQPGRAVRGVLSVPGCYRR